MADRYLRLLFNRKKDKELILWLSRQCPQLYPDEGFGRAVRRRLNELMNRDKKAGETK